MTKQELEKKIEGLENQLALLKLEHFSKEKHSIWKPENKEQYFYINASGDVMSEKFDGFACEKSIIDFGNYFKSQEEAEKQANYQKYTNLLRKYVEEHSEPLDWNNDMLDKWELYYDYDRYKIETNVVHYIRTQGAIYASSKEVLLDAIKFVGEENVLKYIFEAEV